MPGKRKEDMVPRVMVGGGKIAKKRFFGSAHTAYPFAAVHFNR